MTHAQVTLCMGRGGRPIRGRARGGDFFGRARCDGRALGLLLMARVGTMRAELCLAIQTQLTIVLHRLACGTPATYDIG